MVIKMRIKTRKLLTYIPVYTFLILGTLITLLPLFWQITVSLKSSNTIFETVPRFLPNEFNFSNYTESFVKMRFSKYFMNTLLISVTAVAGTVFSCSLTAFGFSRLNFKGRNILFALMLSTLMLPSQVTLVPLYITYARLGWIDTYLPLIAPHLLGDVFYMFMLRQFFLTIPKDLDEAATIDGCGKFRIYWNIMMPLCTPILLTVIILKFNFMWNDFVGPLIYINDSDKYTLSLGLYIFKASEKYGTQWNYLMASSTIMMLPVLLIYALFQKHFIESIAVSGLKA